MERMKLTPAQIDAINDALSHYGDADHLINMHRRIIDNGCEWSEWNALNELSVTTLSHALKYGCEVDQEPKTAIRTVNIAPLPKESDKLVLELELDYELASLYDAMQQGDQEEISRCKQRLAEIHKELESSK